MYYSDTKKLLPIHVIMGASDFAKIKNVGMSEGSSDRETIC